MSTLLSTVLIKGMAFRTSYVGFWMTTEDVLNTKRRGLVSTREQ